MAKQAFIQIDFAFASAIFVLLFTVVLVIFHSGEYRLTQDSALEELRAEAELLCSFLIESPGNPETWYGNVSAASYVGLRDKDGSLQQEKVEAFNQSNYFPILDSLGLGSKYLNLKMVGQDTGTTYINLGESQSSVSIGKSVCYGHYANETVKLLVEVWK